MFNKELLIKTGFSTKAAEYITSNKNYGELKDFSIKGEFTGSCGDTIILYLKINENIIENASFIYTGCSGSAASGAAVSELIKGKTIEEAKKIDLQSIIDFYTVEGKSIPLFKHDCGEIAVNALKNTLKN